MATPDTSHQDRSADAGHARGGLQQPPMLFGYTYQPADAYAARDDGRLLAIRLETNTTCNLRCRYCYAQGGDGKPLVADFEMLADTVRQAHDMGAQSVVIIGGGEPTLHSRFADLVALVDSLGMVPTVFTNCVRVGPELAVFLHDHNASVMGKMDSMRPPVQDYLAGVDGAFRRIQAGLGNLLDAGFGEPDEPGRLRLGLSFVSCRLNVEEVEHIWRFCRQRNIFPKMEVLTPTGRALQQLPDQGLEREQIQAYKNRLLALDRAEYGYDWLPYTPLAGSSCLQHFCSLYVTLAGDVRPCAPTKFDQHPDLQVDGMYPFNIHRRSLRAIYEAPLFRYVRHIDSYLEGACSECRHNEVCVGCRGYAYATGVNEGKSSREALRGECRQCMKEWEVPGP